MKRTIQSLGAMLGMASGIFAQSPARIWDHITSMEYDIPTSAHVMLSFNGTDMPVVNVLDNEEILAFPLSVSDPVTGALKFTITWYSLLDANWQATPNSDLWAAAASAHGFLTVIPYPGDRNKFYLITRACGIPCSEYRWTLYDGSLNGGLGDVDPELVDQPWFTGGIGDLHDVISSADGNTYWFVTHEPGNSNWTLHPVTAQEGINAAPVTISGGPAFTDEASFTNMWLVVAPSNDKVLCRYKAGGIWQVVLLEFDNANGSFVSDGEASLPYTAERPLTLSPGGNFVYKVGFDEQQFNTVVDQFDLSAGDGTAIWNSRQQIPVPELGTQEFVLHFNNTPDGRLWIDGSGGSPYFTQHIIPMHEPDLPGVACEVADEGVDIGVEFVSSFWFPDLWWPISNNTTSVAEAVGGTSGPSLSVMPNPATEQVTVSPAPNAVVQDAELVLRDQLGRIVQRLPWRTGSTNLTFDVRDLPSGMYTVTLRSDEAFIGTARFLRR